MKARFPLLRHVTALGALALLAAACAEPTTAPSARSVDVALVAASKSGDPASTSAVTTYWLDLGPKGGRFEIGAHRIDVEAGAVCDPKHDQYERRDWDDACPTTRETIRVWARLGTSPTGHPSIEFGPNIRFAPDKIVTLWMYDPAAARAGNVRIYWCKNDKKCVDESVDDPSVRTQYDPAGGWVFGRIKHFSGYMIADS